MAENKKMYYLDIARGIAIFLVVLGHVYMTDDSFNRWIYSFHVPIFFVITGIIMESSNTWKNNSIGKNLKIEARRLLYPYITFCILAYMYIVYVYFFEVGRVTYTRLYTTIIDILILEGTSALWFLPAMFFAKVMYMLTYKHKILSSIQVIVSIVVMYVISQAINIISKDNLLTSYLVKILIVIGHSICGYTFIYIGKYVYYLFEKLLCNANVFIKIIMVIMLWMFNIYIQQDKSVDVHMCVFGDMMSFYGGAISGSIALIGLCNIVKRCKIIEYFGRNSLIVMATHKPLPVLYYSLKLVTYIDIISYRSVAGRVFVALITMCIEIVFIELINQKLSFILKLRPRKNN